MPVARKRWMTEPISADGLYNKDEECGPKELASDGGVQGSYQVGTIGDPADDQGRQRHGEKIYE
jgi:hypothetical protein